MQPASDLAQPLQSRVHAHPTDMNGLAIRAYVERIERLEQEIKDLNGDKSEVYKEAKGNGYDPKVLRAVIKHRAEDQGKRAELDTLLDLYLRAIEG